MKQMHAIVFRDVANALPSMSWEAMDDMLDRRAGGKRAGMLAHRYKGSRMEVEADGGGYSGGYARAGGLAGGCSYAPA